MTVGQVLEEIFSFERSSPLQGVAFFLFLIALGVFITLMCKDSDKDDSKDGESKD